MYIFDFTERSLVYKQIQMKENEIIFYSTPNGKVKVEILFEDETFWLSQKRLAALFGVEVNTINYHLKEIFKSRELQENSVIRKIRITELKEFTKI